MLSIFVGMELKIEENIWLYLGFWIGVFSIMGEDSMILLLFNLDYCFVVYVLKVVNEISEEMVVKVYNIINMEKLVYIVYCL